MPKHMGIKVWVYEDADCEKGNTFIMFVIVIICNK